MRQITEFLSTKVAKPSIIKATDETIKKIVKDELDRLGHDCDLNHIDVSEVTNMSRLFSCHYDDLGKTYCDLNPDISKWNVSNVENMELTFYLCKNFNCDLSQWNIRKTKNMFGMFCECKKFNQDLSGWNVSSVIDMWCMFDGCEKFNQNLSLWDVNNVKQHDKMFNNCPIKKEYKPKFN